MNKRLISVTIIVALNCMISEAIAETIDGKAPPHLRSQRDVRLRCKSKVHC